MAVTASLTTNFLPSLKKHSLYHLLSVRVFGIISGEGKLCALQPKARQNQANRMKRCLLGLDLILKNLLLGIGTQIGSAFEYVNQNPVFGVLNVDSAFYAPVLGFFAFTGIPTSAFLWYKSVQAANKEAEELDRRVGFL